MLARRKTAIVLAFWISLAAAVLAPPVAEAGSGALELLTIETGAAVHTVRVEIARTPEERGVGLMHRPVLAPDRGMLFDFGAAREVTMWMKNTLIPLDMFFADGSGRIVTVAERATPLSETRIRSGRPVRFVLEMVGGSAARLGIAPGDRLRHALIDRRAGKLQAED